jgi:hypothetical protein
MVWWTGTTVPIKNLVNLLIYCKVPDYQNMCCQAKKTALFTLTENLRFSQGSGHLECNTKWLVEGFLAYQRTMMPSASTVMHSTYKHGSSKVLEPLTFEAQDITKPSTFISMNVET